MAALCAMLTAACWMDYRKRRIPNLLILAMFLYGAGWRLFSEGVGGLAAFAVQALTVICLFYFFFRLGAVGAGDVKLFGVTAGFLPFEKILIFLFVSMLAAATVSLVKFWKKKYFWERFRYLAGYMADVWKSGKWRLYLENRTDNSDACICLSGPILFSLLLYLGGAY